MSRRLDVRRALTKNWPYKVAAVVLSVLLWLRVSAGQARVEQPVLTQLRIEVADTTWSLLQAPTEVATIFQGRGGDMFSFSLFRQPSIRKVITEITGPVMNVPLLVTDVVYDQSLNVTPTSVEPSEIQVRLERRGSRTVAVRVESDARAEDGFYLGSFHVSPDSVVLHGPESLIASIQELSTESFEVGALRARISRQLVVQVPPGLTGIRIEPATVLVSAEVDSLRTRVFQVPLDVAGPYAGDAVVTPNAVRVAVSGGARAIDALVGSDVLARVQVDTPVTEERSQQVLVELPEDVSATADADPPRARVAPAATLARRSGASPPPR